MNKNDDPIKHVVLLILENHSFDQMLGAFQEVYPDLEGVDPSKPRVNQDYAGHSYKQSPTTERQMLDDPHHELPHVAVQLQDENTGFVKDFSKAFEDSTKEAREFIMGYYPRGFLPALHTLAENFTICDHWHASLPGPTWPNRFFALSGTSNGRVDMPDDGTHKVDLKGYMEQTQDTIFDRLNEAGINWKVYFHDIPQTTVFKHQRHPVNAARYFYISDFFQDARGDEGEFPEFTFIEPCYMGWGQNDDHPPHDIMRAEKLIADVYNAIRSNPDLWESTLLAVYYDEHGGFYDHVVPPKAIPPDGQQEDYTFDQLGLRVPALLISPWVDRRVEHTLFDHTSMLKYLVEKWNLDSLRKRTEAATGIGVAITRSEPRKDTPLLIKLSREQLAPPNPDVEEVAFSDLNAHQIALGALIRYLKGEVVRDLPVIYAWISRFLMACEKTAAWLSARTARLPRKVKVTVADPGRIAHHTDAKPRTEFARYLMRSKQKAIDYLADQLHSKTLTPPQLRQTLRTVAMLTGRAYHNEENGTESALGWMDEHVRRRK